MTTPEKRGCAALLASFFGAKSRGSKEAQASKLASEKLPYRLTQAFLTPAEVNFYHVLRQAVGDRVVVCPKVSLGDLFYAQAGERGANQSWRNRIDRKHVDFLLCEPKTMRPLLGVELDDASHQQGARQERDQFVEQVFAAAGLPLFRQPVRHSYQIQVLAAELGRQLGLDSVEPAPRPAATMKGEQAEGEAPAQVADESPEEAGPGNVSVTLSDGAPLCPICRKPMVLRTVKRAGPHYGRQLWGCADFPQCRGVRPYGVDQVPAG